VNLIDALASGVAGAENGTAELYRRGTATRATWYTDFEGTQAQASGADLVLDESGSIVAYVNELVEVLVKDADGTTAREFVAGAAAPAVEYQGQSFTGTDYVTGAQAAGEPTTVQAVLDLWKTNSGAIDWKVLVNGAATTLQSAVGGVTGLFFNVKDPAYGAVGDGVTNDATAIGAALTAANVSGGVVFFPPGTYRITSALSLGSKASMLGCGPNASAILIDHASNNAISASGSPSYARQSISGLRVGANQANTGHVLSIGAGLLLSVSNCALGDSNCTGDIVTASSSATSRLTFLDCTFTSGGTAGLFNGAGALSRGSFRGCTFIGATSGSYSPGNGLIFGRQIDLIDCQFQNPATGGTYSCFKSNSTTLDAKLIGCDFGSSGGATVTAMELGTYASGAVFYEGGNSFGSSGVTAYSYTPGTTTGADVRLGTRLLRSTVVSNSSTTVTVPTDQYGTVFLKQTGGASLAITQSKAPAGSTGTLVIYNNSGGTLTNIATGAQGGLAGTTVTLTNGQIGAMTYAAMQDLVGASVHTVTGTPLAS
jgi:hypothetical protein